KANLFCRTCLFHSEPDDEGMMEWTLVLPDGTALDQFISKVESEQIAVEIKRISKIVDGKSLTPRQQSIIHYALDRGYFDYPRKTDLSDLAKELKISKSNLSEILRRGAKKALTSHFQ
ncbi:MAG: helix-turn-helix domain-containing protein, partial [Nitrososphaerales archaeon]